MERTAISVTIEGQVQGVSYRAWTEEAARRHGVAGWVRNLVDGRVEAHIEGAADDVAAMENALWEGPRAARVTAVHRQPAEVANHRDFAVRYD
ncbi:acylphosphatase [Tranquillimonas rosea]|uniref:acylphosphatase n=1 Tax=Tranquillimonas rosea TaxID=641238 RepID=UPI003BAC6F68